MIAVTVDLSLSLIVNVVVGVLIVYVLAWLFGKVRS